ncbi:MAG: D-alanine--D-alanine ligase [Bifidobacteriaceae bacterium]|jgi:D-alanine-D-alanine ligase|nr:D-alanine--D-alanine ligase [Bifidobacteriaceae bacterium]
MSATNAHDAKVVVLCGGLSHERDISIASGRRVAGYLEDAGWHATTHDMDGSLLDYLHDPETRPDVVWPLLHGANGEDGSIRDILELADLPYIGTRPVPSRTAWNKPIAKSLVAHAGLSTPRSVTLPESMFIELGARRAMELLVDSLGLPLFVKPTMGGSALGCSLVTKASDLPQAMVTCFAYGQVALIEKAVIGTEVSVSIIDAGNGTGNVRDAEPLILPPIEIESAGIYDYEARYTPGPTKFYVPARLDSAVLATVQDAALTAHRALGLEDISRTDFIVDAEGVPQFLEVNVAPGMTESSLLPQAAVADGHHLPDLYSSLVEKALARGIRR